MMDSICFERRGNIPSDDTIEYIAKHYNMHHVVASVLASRIEKDKWDDFLSPGINCLYKADAFNEMPKAVNIIKNAVKNNEYIYICGDYDVDGICGATIVYRTLKSKTDRVMVAIPERDKEGYGISRNVVDKLISLGGGLIITVDCGISELETLSYAKSNGIKVIITDHHTCPEVLPPADAIINPKTPGENYPDKNLCGAGVAFKLACALVSNNAFEYIDLAAIATIADMVHMTGENRIIASKGLYKINKFPDKAIRALLEATRLQGKVIDSDKISFVVAPRINAAGRVGMAEIAFRLFCGDEHGKPVKLAKYASMLCSMNRDRQELQQQIINEITPQLEANPDRANVFCGKDWPVGVIGLAAAWSVQHSGKPTILMTFKDNLLTGSARSIDGIDIFEILKDCEQYLVRYGGHSQAAGLSVDPENDGFEKFRKAFTNIVNDSEKYPESVFVKKYYYDVVCRIRDFNPKFYSDLNRLAPFGMGNPSVKILVNDVETSDVIQFGNGQHCRFIVKQDGITMPAVLFGNNGGSLPARCSLVASLSKNDYTNQRELVVEAING